MALLPKPSTVEEALISDAESMRIAYQESAIDAAREFIAIIDGVHPRDPILRMTEEQVTRELICRTIYKLGERVGYSMDDVRMVVGDVASHYGEDGAKAAFRK